MITAENKAQAQDRHRAQVSSATARQEYEQASLDQSLCDEQTSKQVAFKNLLQKKKEKMLAEWTKQTMQTRQQTRGS